MRKYIVPAAKRVGADVLEFAAPEIAEVVERISRQLQRVWENSRVVIARKDVQAESLQQNLQNKPVGREETFSQTFFINHVEQFSVTTFCGIFWKSWRGSPSS